MTENVSDIHKILKEEILKREVSKRVHEDEYVTKCPICNEIGSSGKHGHCYVGFKDDGNVFFMCHRCGAKGKFTPDILRKFDIKLDILREFFEKINKIKIRFTANNMAKSLNRREKYINYKLPKPLNGKDDNKIEYFEKRTGIKITDESTDLYSLIFNLENFLNENNININSYNRDKKLVIKELSDNFIGFLSSNKSIISFRAVNRTNFSKNKFNFVIDEDYRQPFYYIPKTTVDLLTLQPKIVLAEGTFDIINVKKRFFANDTTDTIFASVGGKAAYRKILKEIISITGFLNPEIMFFSDKDVDVETYIKNVLGTFYGILHGAIYYNQLNKDWGEIEEDYKFEIYKF